MTDEKTTSGRCDPLPLIGPPETIPRFDFGSHVEFIDERQYVFNDDGTIDIWLTFLPDEEI